MMRFFVMITLLFVFVGCASTAVRSPNQATTPTPVNTATPQRPVWGDVQALAEVQQWDAPASRITDGAVLLVWAGADTQEARLYARHAASDAQIIALRALSPRDLRLLPLFGKQALFWIDRDGSGPGTHLNFATLDAQGVAQQDTIRLSEGHVQQYDAARLPDGTLRTVWSARDRAVSRLYGREIDLQGRPYTRDGLQVEGTHPQIVLRQDERVQLYWLDDEWTVRTAFFASQADPLALETARSVAAIPAREPTDVLESFRVAQDETHTALFWNIRQIDGNLRTHAAIIPQVGQNVPFARPFVINDTFVDRVVPLPGQQETLPLIVQQGDTLQLVTLRDGQVFSTRPLLERPFGPGTPSLSQDAAGHLHILWTEPNERGTATVYHLTTAHGTPTP